MDAVLLEGLRSEWSARLQGARVDRVTSPADHRIEVAFFGARSESVLSFILVPQAARVYMPERVLRQGGEPTAFAMLLRRRLGGFRVLDIPDPELDRSLTIRLGGRNEFGDPETRTLVFEGFGPRPNLILVDGDGRITDSFRRVAPDPEGRRGRLPGLEYEASARTAGNERIDPRSLTPDALWALLEATPPSGRLAETLSRRLQGISPLWAREILATMGRARDAQGTELAVPRASADPSVTGVPVEAWEELRKVFCGDVPEPGVAVSPDGRVLGAFPRPPRQYGPVPFEAMPSLTAAVCAASERIERDHVLDARRSALVREVRRRRERLVSRLAKQQEEWAESERDLAARHHGELLLANLYRIAPGLSEVWLEDWEASGTGADPEPTDPQGPSAGPDDAAPAPTRVRIALDPKRTAAEYAQRLFVRYQKAKRRQAALTGEMARGRSELAYMDALEDDTRRAEDLQVLDALAHEAEQAGTLAHPARPKHVRKGARSQRREELAFHPLQYRTPGGSVVWAGRTAGENDRLTLHEADADDLWFHVMEGAGAHVILHRDGLPPPSDEDCVAAAKVAAYHSPQAQGSHVEVVQCRAGHVRRMPGGRPGLVLYERERSYSVTPDAKEIAAMRSDATTGAVPPSGTGAATPSPSEDRRP